MKLRALMDGLARLDVARVQHEALAEQASVIAASIRRALDQAPGGPHDYPWRESGKLQDSIGVEIEGSEAVIGSTDDVALYQEYGTSNIPPRPFLAPLAAENAGDGAIAIAEAVVDAMRSL